MRNQLFCGGLTRTAGNCDYRFVPVEIDPVCQVLQRGNCVLYEHQSPFIWLEIRSVLLKSVSANYTCNCTFFKRANDVLSSVFEIAIKSVICVVRLRQRKKDI